MISLLSILFFCSESPSSYESDPEPEIDYSQNRGRLISTFTDFNVPVVELTWLNNSNKLLATGFFGINVIDTSSGDQNIVEDRDIVYSLKQSKNGDELFYILGGACYPSCSEDLY